MTEQASDKLKLLMQQPERKAVKGNAMPENLLSPDLTAGETEMHLHDTLISETVGKMFSLARKERKLSVRELAKKVSVSHPRVVAVENAGDKLEIQTLARFAQALNYDLEISLVPRDGKATIKSKLSHKP